MIEKSQKSPYTNKIAHIGIAVHQLDTAIPFYTESLGLLLEGIEEVYSEAVKIAFLKVGDTRFELVEPMTEDSTMYAYLQKHGEGIHHIALEVDHIQERLSTLQANGIRLIDEAPKIGANDSQIAFLHPSSTNGVLFELCQRSKGDT